MMKNQDDLYQPLHNDQILPGGFQMFSGFLQLALGCGFSTWSDFKTETQTFLKKAIYTFSLFLVGQIINTINCVFTGTYEDNSKMAALGMVHMISSLFVSGIMVS